MNLLALFFVIDCSHSKKRILAFKNNVKNLSIVSYYRDETVEYKNHYNLGKIPQKKYLHRFFKIILDIPRLSKILSDNSEVNVVYAWNFDIALLFVLTNLFSKRRYKFIYEVTDIKPILLSNSIAGRILRMLEKFILKNTDYLCVTSEDFITNYFDKYYNFEAKIHVLENKVYPPIAQKIIKNKLNKIIDGSKWKIGLVGIFRCDTSLQLLSDLAIRLPESIEVVIAGRPEKYVIESFNKLIGLKNTIPLGEYKYPDNLVDVYSEIDIIWSADFSDLSDNSKWLLPNRIYEAGLFAIPQLCFSENEAISKYIKSLNIGWILEEANIENLVKFFSSLTGKQYEQIRSNYNGLPTDQFAGDEQVKLLLKDIKGKLQYEKSN